ncbi:hypothetical protein NKJ26_27440 [Mesorhizobium sp. M0152]|uniref:hypothetical protein n=1 Tax=Mesorhizobium sp. M0152 TaxID=2956898 RepID=UPI0033369F97
MPSIASLQPDDARSALEVILGAELVDATTAERYGWNNRALPVSELDDFVDQLARNIDALPEGVIAAAKRGAASCRPARRLSA